MWLDKLGALKKEISVGIIGAGSMGVGLLYQSTVTPGITCTVIADIEPSRAIAAAKRRQVPYRVVSTIGQLHDAVDAGLLAITEDGNLVSDCRCVDVVIESSSSIDEGALFAEKAILNRKHLVLMNAEIDLAFGPYFCRLSEDMGVVYTSCDGDQHGVLKRLYDELTLWGFRPVMAGNIKGFLDRYSNPTKIIPEADKRSLDYRMATAYTDGTKLAIEMALVSNALNFAPSQPGMTGPRMSQISEVYDVFDFDSLFSRDRPVVDYVLAAEPGGGVFFVGHCDDPYQQSMLSYYKMGNGPFYLFYRPYHLCHIEAMQCIAEACIHGTSLLQPYYGFCANVNTFAKKDLKAGEVLDGLGGYATYGLLEEVNMHSIEIDLPICISHGVTLNRDIEADGRITLKDVIFEKSSVALSMYEKALDRQLITSQPATPDKNQG